MARNVISISEAEILSEIEGAISISLGPKDAKTRQEIQEAKGWSEEKTLRALQAFGKQGRLMAHQVQRKSIDGRDVWVPAYTVIPITKKSSRATRPR